jgi:hypothetical protein
MLMTMESPHTLGTHRFWKWTALFLGILAIGKGIREPNRWSMTQAQVDYSLGFIRRGLFGTLLKSPLHLNIASHYAALSLFLLLLLFFILGWLALRSGLVERIDEGEVLALFASSYTVTYLAHIDGYLDIPLAILCMVPLFVRNVGLRFATALACAAVGILIHEQFLFAFLPVTLLSFVVTGFETASRTERRLAWGSAMALALLATLLTFFVSLKASLTASQVQLMAAHVAASVDFKLDANFFSVLSRSSADNLALMKTVWRRPTFYLGQIQSVLLFFPTAALLIYALWRITRKRFTTRTWPIMLMALIAVLSPLCLNVVGWDKNRWSELVCLNAFIALITVCRFSGREPVTLPRTFLRLCLIVMMLNMATGGGMLDQQQIRPFPFIQRATQGSSSVDDR